MLINPLSCLDHGNILLTPITLTKLSIRVVFNSNKIKNGFGFWGKNIKSLKTPLYDPKLKLLFCLNLKIVITRCVFAIPAFLAYIKSFNRTNNIDNTIVAFYKKL